jgi:cell division protein FtsI (penicillin-binding protein 3)
MNAVIGSAKKIDIPGNFAGGKTGTVDELIHEHYATDRVNTTFMSVVPADKPKYLFTVKMEDPQAAEGTYGFHTSAWNSGEVCGEIMKRVTPLLSMPPDFELPTSPFPHAARQGVDLSSVMRN